MQCINVMPLLLLHGGVPQHTRELERQNSLSSCHSASQLMPVSFSPHPLEQRPLPPPCPAPASYSLYSHSAEHKDLFFPQHLQQKCLSSAPSELPQLLFVLPFKQLLMACGTSRSWQGSSFFPRMLALGISSFCQEPASQRGLPFASDLKINMLLLGLQASTVCARVLPANAVQAAPAWWCHRGGTGHPLQAAQITQEDRQSVSNGRCEYSREQMPPLEEAARHRSLQEDLLLKLDQCGCGELQLISATPLSLHFSCGWPASELQAGTWILAAAEVCFSVLASFPVSAWLVELVFGVLALSKLRKHLNLPGLSSLPSELLALQLGALQFHRGWSK